MSRDSTHTHLHLHASSQADLLEAFTNAQSKLPAETIDVPPHHQPLNPEDEDDIVPDQHAAFGIQRATQQRQQRRREGWRDWGLGGFLTEGPPKKEGGGGVRVPGAGGFGAGFGGSGAASGSSMPR
ncbi:hypothetical protein MBLNU230_g4529t1 [Neophaeotheca triangularis]